MIIYSYVDGSYCEPRFYFNYGEMVFRQVVQIEPTEANFTSFNPVLQQYANEDLAEDDNFDFFRYLVAYADIGFDDWPLPIYDWTTKPENKKNAAILRDFLLRYLFPKYWDCYLLPYGKEDTEEEKERMNKNAFIPLSDQPIKIKPVLSGLRKMNLQTGEVTKIADVEFKVGHIQSSRFNPDEIVFCNETGGDAAQRMWYAKSDGSVVKPLYKETPLDWVTHETFASRDYVYFNILGFQPRLRKQASGILRINLRNDDVELLGQVEMNADGDQLRGRGFWHCNATRDDKWSAGDTFAGSVWLINNETGQRHHIATETRMRPDHSHPAFSPDCKKMIFQSGHFTNGKRLNLMMVDLTKQAFWGK